MSPVNVLQNGLEGENCDECVKYHDCPDNGFCIEPNQCICGYEDCNTNDDGLRQLQPEIIKRSSFQSWSECDKGRAKGQELACGTIQDPNVTPSRGYGYRYQVSVRWTF